jgi:hypothetical protein
VTSAVAIPTATASASPATAAAQQITVNLSHSTGAILHGASGALYGLSEDGVPGADLIDPLHPITIAQGPANAAQHPSGHADQVASEFFGAGGKWLLVYMQDYYSQWPYQNPGISSYLATVDTVVSSVKNSPHASSYVFVPFNEPNNIWYNLDPSGSSFSSQMSQFEQDWTTVYQRIRADDPGALIAGPNTSYYDPTVMADFLSYAKANNVLPNIITWHELSTSSLQTYPANHASLVSIEQRDGITALPVDIDEYADRYYESVPGEMVQWLAMLESTKAYGDLAYWDIADNYSDTAVRNDEPNGQWWLFDWYGAMTGDTVQVTAPDPATPDTLQGLATLDRVKKQARIIVADPSGSKDTVAITGISSATFGQKVHVSVQSIGWTGYDGSAYTPVNTAETDATVANGTVDVPLGQLNPAAAYQIIVTPAAASGVAAPSVPQTQQYLAADASLTDATVYSQGSTSNYNGYYTAGGEDVGSIDQLDSRVTFNVTAHQTGRYFLSVYYGNQTEDIAQQITRVDGGAWSFINYPPTLNWLFRSHQDRYLNLTAGTHTITFGVSDPSIGTAKGQVTLDDIQLTYAPNAVLGVTGPAASYPAAYAGLSGGATTTQCPYACPAGQVVTGPKGGGTAFTVDAAQDGYYDLGLNYATTSSAARFSLTADGSQLTMVKATATSGHASGHAVTKVYLHAGINPVQYVAQGAASTTSSLTVAPDTAANTADATTYAAAATQNTLSGAAVVQANQYAYGGSAVGYIGNGSANTLTFNGIKAASAGPYRVMLSYADDEREGTGNYNTNLVDRGLTVSTSAGTSETVYVRNTYGWDQFNTFELTVLLNAGTNTITFGNPTAYAPNIDKITVAAASVP